MPPGGALPYLLLRAGRSADVGGLAGCDVLSCVVLAARQLGPSEPGGALAGLNAKVPDLRIQARARKRPPITAATEAMNHIGTGGSLDGMLSEAPGPEGPATAVVVVEGGGTVPVSAATSDSFEDRGTGVLPAPSVVLLDVVGAVAFTGSSVVLLDEGNTVELSDWAVSLVTGGKVAFVVGGGVGVGLGDVWFPGSRAATRSEK